MRINIVWRLFIGKYYIYYTILYFYVFPCFMSRHVFLLNKYIWTQTCLLTLVNQILYYFTAYKIDALLRLFSLILWKECLISLFFWDSEAFTSVWSCFGIIEISEEMCSHQAYVFYAYALHGYEWLVSENTTNLPYIYCKYVP